MATDTTTTPSDAPTALTTGGSGPARRVERVLQDERVALVGSLIEVTGRLTRALGADLEARFGLPLVWYDVLIRLSRTPGRRMTMTEISTQTLLTSGGVTRLIDRVAEAGYVERQDCPTDRRSTFVVLTEAGLAKVVEATAAMIEGVERHLLATLDPGDREALRTALAKILDGAAVCGG
jgi:DNA-binding MarR family transcriptional regulator